MAVIGQNLVMSGGIDPHSHPEMPFMGTSTAQTWESGTFAAASGGTTMIVDQIIFSQKKRWSCGPVRSRAWIMRPSRHHPDQSSLTLRPS